VHIFSISYILFNYFFYGVKNMKIHLDLDCYFGATRC